MSEISMLYTQKAKTTKTVIENRQNKSENHVVHNIHTPCSIFRVRQMTKTNPLKQIHFPFQFNRPSFNQDMTCFK